MKKRNSHHQRRRRSATTTRRQTVRRLSLERLESRLLCTATPDPPEIRTELWNAVLGISSYEAPAADNTLVTGLSVGSTALKRQELVFVDGNLNDYLQLVGNLAVSDDRDLSVVMLDSSQDGFAQ